MNIREFLEECDKYDQDTPTRLSFIDTFSSRASYDDLGVEYEVHSDDEWGMTIGELRAVVENALGHLYEGYKGGTYRMTEFSDIWLCKDYSSYDDVMSEIALKLSLN